MGRLPHLWVVTVLAVWAGVLRVRAELVAAFLSERDRWPLWLPVMLGIGIGVYFAVPTEPPAGTGVVVLGLAGLTAVALRHRPPALLALGLVALTAAGFALAQAAAQRNAGPVVASQTPPLTLHGRVAAVEIVGGTQRIELDALSIDRQPAPPRKVRLRLTRQAAQMVPGQRMTVRAVLRPPPAPSLPGGFDFARQAWFDGLGAVGFAVGEPSLDPAPPAGPGETLSLWLAALRHRVTLRMAEVIGGEEGAVAAALVTGERAAVSEKTWDEYRDSGLAHLLSISGVHFSMVAGLVFALVRGVLAAIPGVALRYPIKKWTAVIALAASLFYLLLSGVSVPAQRSFASIAIVLLAVVVDRKAISLRTVAWAALAVLAWQPQALVGASFQMSFAAVIALIAAFEAVGPRLAEWKADRGLVRRIALYGGGIAFTSVVASAATTFYTIFHFSRFSTWSVASNLLAVPLTGAVVMPAALVALLLMPFGLDEPALVVMGWGVDGINRLAAAVASWPGAAVVVAPVSVGAVAVYSLGGLWLCLWRRRWRLLGLVPMAAALLTIPLHDWPDLLIDGDGQMMAVRAADGGLLYASLSRGAFVRDAWAERAGNGRPARDFTQAEAADRLACDAEGCLWRGRGQPVALIRRAEAQEDDCALARVVVAAVPLRHRCPSATIVIDRNALWRNGPHAVWLNDMTAVSVRAWRGERPWVIRPEARK